MLAIPYAAKFSTPKDINILGNLLYNTYGMNNNNECRSASDIIKILGEHLKSNGTSFQGIVWTK